ncbi:Protein of unknown function [Pseudonocardia thermophila]|uniref:Heparan-alpha-glucosaminide N-acetyltransferase catalytic domain-containing protein n=1 Tax=Pseudonocardia thermophila TaxID=1848 RepID=A0A1M6NJW5_PSETH|nr:heparan-alpha-glucosaminide N-acetyltransferase domain-containing protein [Pseudonocardia thermophila]SHJ96031.1 Protein of unknown function [Pseudonocardia thermophila]
MPRRDRIAGVDAARSVALVGMVATHILPIEHRDGTPTAVGLLFDGRASALFAVLAGVGIALSTGGRVPPGPGRPHVAAGVGIAVRAVLIAVIGLLLADLRPLPLVILAYYGLLFLVSIPVLRLPPWLLGGLAAVWCGLSPVLSQLLRGGTRFPVQVGTAAVAAPGEMLWTLAVTGVYPVLTWTTYLLVGLAVGRLDLMSPRVAAVLLAGGTTLSAGASAVSAFLLGPGGGAEVLGRAADERLYGTTPTWSWWWLAIAAPHSGTPFDLARTTGSALAVLGLMLLLARWAAPLVWLPAAVGSAPLSLYAFHVVLTTVPMAETERPAVFVVHVVLLAVIGALLRGLGVRGPLEAVVGFASRWARDLVRGPERVP